MTPLEIESEALDSWTSNNERSGTLRTGPVPCPSPAPDSLCKTDVMVPVYLTGIKCIIPCLFICNSEKKL